MPFSAFTVVPGVNLEKTPALNHAGISISQNVRWREGIPEKRGGWQKFINAVFPGVPRELHAWEDINFALHLAIGTTSNLFVITSGSISDITAESVTVNIAVNLDSTNTSSTITVHDVGRNATIYDVVVFDTPVSIGGIVLSGAYQISQAGGADQYEITATNPATSTVTGGGAVPSFTTTSGSAAVIVTLADHGYVVGDVFPVGVSTDVGGVTLSGQYIVTSVPSVNTFVINATNSATSSTTGSENGGNLSLTYYVTRGPTIAGSGFGIGAFGAGGFGTGVAAPVSVAPSIVATDYWLDNWGGILMSLPTGGPLFYWSPNSGYANSAMVSGAPSVNAGMFIAMPEQMVVVWGSTYSEVGDPLQIRWSDSGDFTTWVSTSGNQAGGYRIPTGSRVVRGLQAAQQLLFWTDIDLYAAQYIGAEFVWGFNKVSGSCGLIAPKAVATLGSAVYWMSQKQFFMYGGSGAVPIDCPVWDAVFQNLNTAYVDNIRGGGNAQFNEVSWDFPSLASTSGENDMRVTYNVLDKEWDVQALGRSAWIDQSVLGAPIGSTPDGVIYQHEVSPDADGVPLVASFTTGLFCIGESEEKVFVDWMMPDFKYGQYGAAQGAAISISFATLDYPGDTPISQGTFVTGSTTEFIEPRFRSRYVQMTISSNDLGSFWRLGKVRYRYATDGRV